MLGIKGRGTQSLPPIISRRRLAVSPSCGVPGRSISRLRDAIVLLRSLMVPQKMATPERLKLSIPLRQSGILSIEHGAVSFAEILFPALGWRVLSLLGGKRKCEIFCTYESVVPFRGPQHPT